MGGEKTGLVDRAMREERRQDWWTGQWEERRQDWWTGQWEERRQDWWTGQ